MPSPLPIRERGYPHPELLAETDWLADRLSDPTVRVVDARMDKDYAAGHIPGAVHISGFALGGIRPDSEMPEPEAFAEMVGALGIDEHLRVVVYDDGGRSPMSRPTNRGRSQLSRCRACTADWTRRRPPSKTTAPSCGTCAASASSTARRPAGILRPGLATSRGPST